MHPNQDWDCTVEPTTLAQIKSPLATNHPTQVGLHNIMRNATSQ